MPALVVHARSPAFVTIPWKMMGGLMGYSWEWGWKALFPGGAGGHPLRHFLAKGLENLALKSSDWCESPL